jgi:hypothetical protein
MTYSRTLVLILVVAAAPAGASEQSQAGQARADREQVTSGDAELVSQVRRVVGAMLTRLPNYTCLETLEQTARAEGQSKFRLVDRVRVEVAFVNGTELYAWPGSPKFDTRNLQQVVISRGAIGTGDFGAQLKVAYGPDIPLQVAGRDSIKGRDAWRFTQSVPASLSHFDIIVPPRKATVAYAVTAWHDATSLDLLRFELVATEFPRTMPIRRTFKATEYETVPVNGLPVRLPAMTELSMTQRNGVENRTVSTFSNCREYRGESKLIFEEPPNELPNAAPQPPEILSLPAGLEVRTRLEKAVELTQAARGDLLVMAVTNDVFRNGRKLLSAGAKVKARWQYFGCSGRPVAYCFAALKTESFEDGSRSGPFAAALESPSLEFEMTSGAQRWEGRRPPPIPKEISHLEKGTAALYMGILTKLPRGYRLIWRTLEVSGGPKP